MTTLRRWRHLAYLLWKYGTRNVVNAVHDYNERPSFVVYTSPTTVSNAATVSWTTWPQGTST